MSRKISLACQPGIESLSVTSILPIKHLSPTIRKSPKYQCIAASIRAIGIIEPLVVYPQTGQRGVYMLLHVA